jgi:hypothetical protein
MEAITKLGLTEWIGSNLTDMIAAVPEGKGRLIAAMLLIVWISAIVSAFIEYERRFFIFVFFVKMLIYFVFVCLIEGGFFIRFYRFVVNFQQHSVHCDSGPCHCAPLRIWPWPAAHAAGLGVSFRHVPGREWNAHWRVGECCCRWIGRGARLPNLFLAVLQVRISCADYYCESLDVLAYVSCVGRMVVNG